MVDIIKNLDFELRVRHNKTKHICAALDLAYNTYSRGFFKKRMFSMKLYKKVCAALERSPDRIEYEKIQEEINQSKKQDIAKKDLTHG